MRWIITLIFSLLVACKNTTETKVTTLLEQWNNKEILFPKTMNLISYVDTNKSIEFEKWKAKYTILHYIDTLGCVSCKLQLSKWKKIAYELDTISNSKVKCLLYFSPISKKSLLKSFRINKYNHYVCIDQNDSLNILNKFPKNEMFHTFLINKENKVLAVGNPIQNPKIKELFLKIIREDTTNLNKDIRCIIPE